MDTVNDSATTVDAGEPWGVFDDEQAPAGSTEGTEGIAADWVDALDEGDDEPSAATEPATKAAPKAPAQEPETTPAGMKLKVNGQELELTPEEVVLWAQKGMSATQRYNEAAKLKREAEALKAAADPAEFFKALGVDPLEWAARQLVSVDEESRLTPEQREAREKQRRLEQYEKAEKARAEQEREAAISAEAQRYKTEIDSAFTAALAETSLPTEGDAGKVTLATMAGLYQDALRSGFEPTPKQLARAAERQTKEQLRTLVGKGDAAKIAELLGDDLVEAIRKHDLSKRLKKVPVARQGDNTFGSSAPAKKPGSKRHLTEKEFDALLWK